MLNIQNRISLSKASKKKIKTLKKKESGSLNKDSWSKINKSVKNELSKKLLFNQDFKCAYCERLLTGLSPEIDHFAYKAKYPEFSFIPNNLFYACHYCNSSIKGKKSTVRNKNQYYHLTTFNIVHPLRDNPDAEIIFRDSDKVDLDISKCSILGLRTIIFFNLHKKTMSMIRAKTLIYERLNPLTNEEEKELIQEAIAYK